MPSTGTFQEDIHMKTTTIRTRKKDEVVDITETVEESLREMNAGDGVGMGVAAHTTCAITTTDLDLLGALRRLLPKMSYRHPHDPAHTPDHILSSLIGPSVTVPYANGRLLLGTWQRIILVELDGPRQRTVHIASMA